MFYLLGCKYILTSFLVMIAKSTISLYQRRVETHCIYQQPKFDLLNQRSGGIVK